MAQASPSQNWCFDLITQPRFAGPFTTSGHKIMYILILAMVGFNAKGVAIASVEFNTLPACQAAAAEWSKQYNNADTRKAVVFCAAKGDKK